MSSRWPTSTYRPGCCVSRSRTIRSSSCRCSAAGCTRRPRPSCTSSARSACTDKRPGWPTSSNPCLPGSDRLRPAVPWQRAAGATPAGGAGPAPLGQDRGDLAGHLARLAGDVGPPVAQGDDPVGGAGVVAPVIAPALPDRVRRPPVELDADQLVLVEVVQVADLAVADDAGLTLGAGQPVGPLDSPDVARFEVGPDPVGHVVQAAGELGSPARLGARGQGGP